MKKSTPNTHFMAAGNRPFGERVMPTRQDYVWHLDALDLEIHADDPFVKAFQSARAKSRHVNARFGQWLYTRRTKEFQTRYNAMLKLPHTWESIRNSVAESAIAAMGSAS